ncbi:MAG: hypothetical protein WBE26_04175 [Phycisphaerae bacterium]
MDVPSPFEPGCLRGSSRAVTRLSVLSVTLRADVVNAAFQLAEYSPKKWARVRTSASTPRTEAQGANLVDGGPVRSASLDVS